MAALKLKKEIKEVLNTYFKYLIEKTFPHLLITLSIKVIQKYKFYIF